ncbi:MAG TPA: hypothetical protein VMV53_01530 [Acidimicrobiales bacterium]|nr:hypothetical protein [Acidimicrobiales bacterium]
MMNDETKRESAPYNPATMVASSLVSSKAVWYKRPWFLITLVVVVVVGVSILTDLPHPITNAEDISAQNASMSQINSDLAPCALAVSEAFSFYNEDMASRLTSAHVTQVKKLLIDDHTACSFASGSVYDLTNNYQSLLTPAGKRIDSMHTILVTWITSDAVAAITDIQYHFQHPSSNAKVSRLAYRESLLAKERLEALTDWQDANNLLATTLTPLKIPLLPHLTGT